MGEVPANETRNWLHREVESWVHDGLISPEQASRILARYEAAPAVISRTGTQKRIAAVFAVLGALLVGIGVILFFASNWSVLPQWVKFSLVVAATGGAYALGYHLRFRRHYVGLGEAVLFLGALLYGAGIFLVGQMFHVEAEPHYGLLLWAVGVLPLAYLLPSRAIMVLAIVVVTSWVWLVTIGGLERHGISGDFELVLQNTLAAGVALYMIGRLHLRTAAASMERPIMVTGAIATLLSYLLFTIDLDAPGRARDLPAPLRNLEYGLLILAFACVAIYVVTSTSRLQSAAEGGGLISLALATWLFRSGVVSGTELGWAWVIPVNLLLFGACLGAVVLGVQREDRILVNLGLTFFSLAVAIRYFDLFSHLLSRSVFFILGGILLLGGGYLIERTRRRLLQQMES